MAYYLVGSIYTFFLTYLFSRDQKLQLHPMTIVLAVWSIGILLTGLFGQYYAFHLPPLAYIMGLLSILALMAVLFSKTTHFEIETEAAERHCRFPFLNAIALLTFCVGMAGVYIQMKSSGFEGGNFIESSAEYTRRRYNDEIAITPLMSLYFTLGYLSSILGGLALAFSSGTSYRGSLFRIALVLVPAILYTMISTARLFTLSMIFNAIGGYIAGLVCRHHGAVSQRLLWKLTMRFTIIAISLATLVVLIQLIRQAKGDFSEIGTVIDHLRPWLAGYIPGFEIWWSENEEILYSGESGSYALLRGVFGLFGVDEVYRTPLIFLTPDSNETTNALTVLHFFVQDLGIIYSLPLMILILLFANYSYAWTIKGSCFGTLSLAVFYSLAIMSINNHALGYGSQILGVVVCAIYGVLFNDTIRYQSYVPPQFPQDAITMRGLDESAQAS